MVKILANDGIDDAGKQLLEDAGIQVVTENVPQEQLEQELKNYDGILVRSATKVRKDLIDACPNLKFIGRAGVGMDNIDVEYARSKGIEVANTPAASSQSVAELVFAHLFTGVRFLHDANRKMPSEGDTNFGKLKKNYSGGIELRGKTIGIIGFGQIGQTVARMALGLGMNIIPFKLHHAEVSIEVDFFQVKDASMLIKMRTQPFEYLLENSDFITLHVPFPPGAESILYKERIQMMKDGVHIINTSRGGVVNEDDILEALNSGKVAFYGADVYEDEPKPRKDLLQHPNVSLTPHIGASTNEAQERVGIEIAERIIKFFEEV